MGERTKDGIRNVALFCIWLFLVWFGLNAIDHHNDGAFVYVLGIYVFLGATGLSVFIGWVWQQRD